MNGAKPDRQATLPIVFAEKTGNAIRLGAVDPAALKAGLHPGLPLADARARIAALQVEDMDRTGDAALLRFLVRACIRYSPSVAIDLDDGLTLDITGCAHLFGGEAVMLHDVTARLRGWGMTPRGAIAGTADAAQALARYGTQGVTAQGQEAAAVAALPVAALRIDPDSAAKLIHLGLKTVGDVAARPRKPLAARFGESLIEQLERTRGFIDVPPPALRFLPACRVEKRFAEPVTQLSAIEQALGELGGLLAQQLEVRGEGGRRFEAAFCRADGLLRRVCARTSRATRDPALMLRLFRERLEALADPLDPGFGFDLVRLAASRSEVLDTRQATLDGRASAESEMAAVIDQLSARLGEAHVLRFVAEDTHDPAHAVAAVPALGARSRVENWPTAAKGEPPLKPVTLFEPPQPIEVALALDPPDGPPVQFRWRRVVYRLKRAEGPERIALGWWRALDERPQKTDATMPLDMTREEEAGNEEHRQAEAQAIARPRDYFRAEDTKGRRFWLFRQGMQGSPENPPRWFLHGLFP